MMPKLSSDLRRMGYVPTGRESPIDENGELWTNGHETVCDETGTVIDGNHNVQKKIKEGVEIRCGEIVYRYRNSRRVKLAGGFTGSYDWGPDDRGRFMY